MLISVKRACILLAVCGLCALAQNEPQPRTRADEIERERMRKEGALQPAASPKTERTIQRYVEFPLTRIFTSGNGFGFQFGGLAQGAGFGLGVHYLRRDLLNENVTFDASLAGSVHQFWASTLQLSLPRLAKRRLEVNFVADHTDSPSLAFFGPGPNSKKSGRTDYRLETTDFLTRVVWKPNRHIFLGARAGSQLINVGPGISGEDPSTETRYTPLQLPGIDRQTNYVTSGPFGIIDFLDSLGDPRKGTALSLGYAFYQDYKRSAYSFRRLDAQLEHYIPFLNKKRVFALRARTQLSYPNQAELVPFYMQPTLGGGDDLRGFEQYRFHDNNSILFSGEYRWEVASALDVALFCDAGNVFPRPGLIGFRNMQEDGGLGFRVKTRDAVVLRLDAAVSHEGFYVWLRFGNAFPLFPSLRR